MSDEKIKELSKKAKKLKSDLINIFIELGDEGCRCYLEILHQFKHTIPDTLIIQKYPENYADKNEFPQINPYEQR